MASSRVPLGMVKHSTNQYSSTTTNFSNIKRGNKQSHSKRGSFQSSTSTVLPISSFPGPQIVRGVSFGHRPFKVESVHKMRPFQNDKPSNSIDAYPIKLLGNHSGHPRCISSCTNSSDITEVSSLLDRGRCVLLSLPSIWSECCTKSLHCSDEIPSEDISSEADKCTCLPRRSTNLGPICRSNESGYKRSNANVTKIRFSDKPQKILHGAHSTLAMARSPMGHCSLQMGSSSFKNKSNHRFSSNLSEKGKNNSSEMGRASRSSCIRMSISDPDETTLSSACKTTTNKHPTGARHHSPATTATNERIDSVDRSRAPQSSSILENSRDYLDNMDRRLPDWVGCPPIKQSICSRQVASELSEEYKCTGNPGNFRSSESIPTLQLPCLRDDRQRISTLGNTETGKQVQSDSRSSDGVIEHCRPTNGDFDSQKNYVGNECISRCSEQRDHQPTGMGTLENNVRQADSVAWSIGSRPDGKPHEQQTSNVHITIQPPGGSRNRCSPTKLEQVGTDLHFPPSQLPSPNNGQTSIISSPRDHHRTMVPNSTMVPSSPEAVDRPPSFTRVRLPIRTRSLRERHITALRQMDRVSFLKYIYKKKFGQKTAKYLTKAHRLSSLRQFQSSWKYFQTWLKPSVKYLSKSHILAFFIHLQEARKLKTATILNYRSALKLPLLYGFNIDTEDREFSLLARAQFIENPPGARTMPKWSLNHALESFSHSRFKNSTASLKDLFLKTLFLFALATGNRVSEIAASTRVDICFLPKTTTVRVREGFLFKNQTLTRQPPPISFPNLIKGHPLCPSGALKEYIDRTSELEHGNHIFLHPNSGVPLTAGRISYWLVKAILSGNMGNVNGVKAHEIRGLAYSAAWTRGLSPQQIVKQGFWVSPNTFIKNYLSDMNAPTTPFVGGRAIINP